MQGSVKRFISEWQLPSVILVRFGIPFVAGLYDVQPTITTERGRQAGKVHALNISILSAVKTALFSSFRYFTHRLLTISFCQLLYSYTSNNKTTLSFLQSAAVEAESSERHTEFSIRQSLRLVGVPENIAGAVTSVTRSTADDIYRFKLESQNNAGFLGTLSTNLQRHLLASALSSIHGAIMHFGIGKLLRPRFAVDGHLTVYLFDINMEVFGITSRRWQLYSAIGSNLSQAVGAAFGAAVASLIAPSSSSGSGVGGDSESNKTLEKTLQVASVLLFLGEFIGGVVGMTVFRGFYIKYRPNVAADAKVEERHYQLAMAELMTYTSQATK